MKQSSPEKLPSDYRRRAIEEQLLRGRDFTEQLKLVLGEASPFHNGDELVTKISNTFTDSLSILHSTVDSDEMLRVCSPPTDTGRKSEDSGDSCRSVSTVKDRRGCYKRRKTSLSWERETPNFADDGYGWRKYGQKSILNAIFPRNYFRCTHKYDQGCQATKQVQRMKEDPPLYKTTYYGNHTCKNNNLLKSSHHMILGSPDADAHDSSIILSFNNNSNMNIHTEDNQLFASFSSSMKQEYSDGQNYNLISNHQSLSSDHHNHHHRLSTFDHADVASGVNNSSSCTTSSDHSFDMGMIVNSIGHAGFPAAVANATAYDDQEDDVLCHLHFED